LRGLRGLGGWRGGNANAPPKFISDAAGGHCIGATDVAVVNATRAANVSAT
jgi:hypothetical protein